MTMPDVSGLPENLDASYGDDPGNPGRKAHQQHHDALHAAAKALLPRAEASATYARKIKPSSAAGFYTSTRNHATQTYICRGIDATAGVVYAMDNTNGVLRISENWGTSWSASKGLPADVTYLNMVKIVRFGAYIYAEAKATATGLIGIYRALPTSGGTALSWSGPLHTWASGSGTFGPCLSAGSTHLFTCEYGDPTGGPQAYRSADGVTWESIYGPDATLRHFHAIAQDPYEPTHVWIAAGDGTAKTYLRSTSSGAPGTFAVAVASSAWQGVQFSFSEDYVWCAGDSQRVTALIIDRDTLTPHSASTNRHGWLAVPGGAAGDLFYSNAYYGAVDPSSGVYYCVANDPSTGVGNRDGMFYLPEAGGRFEIIDRGANPNQNMNSEVFIGGDKVWSGMWNRPLMAL